METARTFQLLREGTLAGSNALAATGVAMIVIGILAILAPLATGLLFNMFFGALFVGAGIVELMDAFRAGTWQRTVMLALVGIVSLAAGALFIARPVVGLVTLTVAFIAYLVFVGAFRIVMAFELPRGMPGKVWEFASGFLALVLAYLAISQMPNISQWLIGTFIGVSLVSEGVSRLSLARGLRTVVGAPATRGAQA
jgi:uncharacterized membrane protein HdeD (DUF308 family)